MGLALRQESKTLGLVWLVCPKPVIALGLQEVLKTQADLYCQHEALAGGVRPSLVILCLTNESDVVSDVQWVKRLSPDIPVVVFDLNAELSFVRATLRAGVSGYIHADMSPEQIVRALSVVQRGEVVVPREILAELVAGNDVVKKPLTHRQTEILNLVAEGLSNAQIARRLYIAESTVKQHLRGIYKALNVKTRTQAVQALREGGSGRGKPRFPPEVA